MPSYLALGKPDNDGNVPPRHRITLGCVAVNRKTLSEITFLDELNAVLRSGIGTVLKPAPDDLAIFLLGRDQLLAFP